MAIPDEDVAAVRSATDIVALIGAHSALRRQGRRWVGLCPFHTEKTPSFSVNGEEGLYYCFGCQASGDAISFVRAIEHLDFADSVRFLADRAGITVREDERATAEHRARARLFEAMELAVSWYHERLLSASDAGPARQYLRSRGYDGAVVRRFRLGWAPEGWDELCKALKLPPAVIEQAGLGFRNRSGRLQDAFRARVLFPICDPSGKPIALGGRILPAAGVGSSGGNAGVANRRPEAKYKNSQESAIYVKRRTLYALNWAKEAIIASGEVVVCEGYTDVIGCFQVGAPRAVATCGTALGEEHFRLLRNFAKRIVLAYDADAAGQNAMARVYEWERKHEVDVAVAAMPPGTDPGELARNDPEALRGAIEAARPFLRFRVDQVLAAADTSSAEGRARAAGHALEVIAEHPDPLVRDPYVMLVADRCQLEPEQLRSRLAEVVRRGPRPPQGRGRGRGTDDRSAADDAWGSGAWDQSDRAGPVPRQATRSEPGAGPSRGAGADRVGMEALRFMVHRRSDIEDSLDEVLFGDELQQQAFTVLYDNPGVALGQLVESIRDDDPAVAELLARLAVEEPTVNPAATDDPAMDVVAQLVRQAVGRAIRRLEVRARSAPSDRQLTVMPDVVALRSWADELEDPAAATAVAERLVAWTFAKRQEDA